MEVQQHLTLSELTQTALVGTDLPTLMQQVVVFVTQTLATEFGAIWEQISTHSALVLRSGYGWCEQATGQATVVVQAPLLATYPLLVADWSSETRFIQPQLLRDYHVCSSLAVVIPGRDDPFGVLSVDTSTHRMFSAADRFVLQAAASVLALALTRMQSDQAIAQQVEARTHAIEQRLVAAAQEKAILEERQRLARDLHDSVTQALYGITLHAQAARRLLASSNASSAIKSIHILQDTAQEALDEMRLLIFELRPPILAQVGLVAALQTRLNAVEGRAHLQTRLIAEPYIDLPPLVEQALYRIAQEALNNALKHAHAQRIIVQLHQIPTSVILDVIDDGVGFEPGAICTTGGLGLRGMAERVAQLNGYITVQSSFGNGACVHVEIAL